MADGRGEPGLTDVNPPAPERRTIARMQYAHHRTIPILPAVAAFVPANVSPPELHGPSDQIDRLLDRLHPAIDAEFGRPVQHGEWLRSVDLHDGEVYVRLHADLGCRARDVAEITFDALRRLLPDTDIYVGA
jgi:hypothetical protein